MSDFFSSLPPTPLLLRYVVVLCSCSDRRFRTSSASDLRQDSRGQQVAIAVTPDEVVNGVFVTEKQVRKHTHRQTTQALPCFYCQLGGNYVTVQIYTRRHASLRWFIMGSHL